MSLHYFRRFRMECDLSFPIPEPRLPKDYSWRAWQPEDLERHAWVKYQSFRSEEDSAVFPCLADYFGCLRLMKDISRQASFVPGATWLVSCNDQTPEDVGTIQGLIQTPTIGAVQNVGVCPRHRGQGLGRALLLQAMLGFREAGLERVSLEVTASNQMAIELYESAGFRKTRTMFRAVDLPPTPTLVTATVPT